MDYWQDCVSEAFDDAGIAATDSQMACVAAWVEGAHDNYRMANGHDCIPNESKLEADRLRRELAEERSKRVCPERKGQGRLISHGPGYSCNSQWWKCHGEGKIL